MTHNCDQCKLVLVSQDADQGMDNLIKFRNLALLTPSKLIAKYLKLMMCGIEYLIQFMIHQPFLKESLKLALLSLMPDFPVVTCDNFPRSEFHELFIRTRIHHTLKPLNFHLKRNRKTQIDWSILKSISSLTFEENQTDPFGDIEGDDDEEENENEMLCE